MTGRHAARSGRSVRALLVMGLLLLLTVLPTQAVDERKLTLLTHDAFFLPESVLARFETTYDVDLEVLFAGDAGSMVNQAILTAERPLADVLYGIDTAYLSRAFAADIFERYKSPSLGFVPAAFVADARHRVTPVDYGDVCLNVDVVALRERGIAIPTSLEDLTDVAYRGALVVENPATSSPGLSFLLATVVYFGDDPDVGWQAFWRALRNNDVKIVSGWTEAYYGSFSGGAGEGDRPIVVSYATSPVAEVGGPEADAAPTAAVDSGCFRQVEFAGILRGTQEPDLAKAFIEYLLSAEVQAELPLSMYVYPVREGVALPDVFEQHGLVPSSPVSMSPGQIDVGRDRWIREWTDIVLR